jgi:hypothetical protein
MDVILGSTDPDAGKKQAEGDVLAHMFLPVFDFLA